MRRVTTITAAALAAALAGCATPARFQAGQAVECAGLDFRAQQRWAQNGTLISSDELLGYLESQEATREDVRTWRRWDPSARAVGLTGVVLLLAGGCGEAVERCWTSSPPALRWTLIGTGSALMLGGLWGRWVAERHLTRAADTYNASLARSLPAAGALAPSLGAVRDTSGRDRLALGLHLTF